MKFERVDGRFGDILEFAPFDVTAFLARPLVGRLATAGPVVRPVWFLWEDENFWVITGSWSRLPARLAANPRFELCVDTCDLVTGEVRQVIARGSGRVELFDLERGRRKLTRYFGPDQSTWPERFSFTEDANAQGVRWARLVPDSLRVADMSYGPVPAWTSSSPEARE
ncbi:pyridoxamine 5'-phosphate oxidase family protein [Kibdelosporangium aridum]|uniref:Pyridoxamine 5'-phosphate oxidase family protein n=1 Tax=Kibdelosporangium aridum TaxID=2030 RepID=A0A428Z4P1_KIBAR|nr:pyridoxamine 5'-phosphate oxidase family protein [Kibdelosporangium aridum]RSM81608.1 pyridoxamine 5'-phosphate oxidase family protein [Kibdelosporangium aridum]